MIIEIGTDEFRIVRRPEFEGRRGEYELQWRNHDGDFENVMYSHDQAEIARFLGVAGTEG